MAHMPLGSANTRDEARMRSADPLAHSDGMDGMAARTPYGQEHHGKSIQHSIKQPIQHSIQTSV